MELKPAPEVDNHIAARFRRFSCSLFQHHLKILPLSLLLYLISIIIFYPVFLPDLSDINPFDEAAYLYKGYLLLHGQGLSTFSSNPFTQLFYALMVLPFKNSVFWMVHACSLGRFVSFTLLWIGACRIGTSLSDRIQPLMLPVMLIISPLMPAFLRFPSDPLYAGFAALALAKTLEFIKTNKRTDLSHASIFLGIAALSRNDGVLLFLVFITLVLLWVILKKKPVRIVLSSAAPFLLLVGGYILLYGIFTGDFNPGTMRRTYDNFETGHGVIEQVNTGLPDTPAAKLAAREAYGTPEENNYSVFTAIRKRPDLYLARVKTILAEMPRAILNAYGLRITAVLILMSVWGVISLLRAKEWERLFLLSFWPAPFVSGFVITIFRTGHLQFYALVVHALAGIGLFTILRNLHSRNTRRGILSALALVTLYGFLDNKLAVAYGGYIFFAAFILIMRTTGQKNPADGPITMMILLAALIITQGVFPTPKIRTLGEDPQEQIVLYISQEMEEVQTFASASPGIIHAARKRSVVLTSVDVPTDNSAEDFMVWLQAQGVEAVYIDKFLTSRSPALWKQIQRVIGNGLSRVFHTDDGSYQILLVDDPLGK